MALKLSRTFIFNDEKVKNVVDLLNDYVDEPVKTPETDDERTELLDLLDEEYIAFANHPDNAAIALQLPDVYAERMNNWLIQASYFEHIQDRKYRFTVDFDTT